ncbi:MAG TPA: glycoside hydrolase family 20 zincin-like fold domain-containing protein [Acidimicrobiia bacterium]|nr:glycoside hydrolase family 20 zincin-like fold domain-containing protein [Acidimicrobiia bacterium]
MFPRPRETAEEGPGCATADVVVHAHVDASLPPEGYALDVGPDGVAITHADTRGRRYADATLAQLLAEHPEHLPGLHIRDWPDFPVRGYMLDVSRDRVPTRETLERLVALCTLARLNHFELYTEHTFAYSEHEVVWRDASPMTADDVRWLDDTCAAAGITLVANQNCFGHMARWLAHEQYRSRAEAPDGFEPIAGLHMAPSVLEPTPENADFAQSLFAELLPNFRARRINVNCDETFDLGYGRSRERVAREGKERVYIDHLRRIVEPLVDDGCAVHYWADIVRKEPSLARELPPGVTPVCWSYEAPGAIDGATAALDDATRAVLEQLGVDVAAHAGFDVNTRPLAEADVPFWVAPGTSAWDSLIGRIDNAQANLLDAARVGRARDAGGYLVTDWGDNGHLQPPSVSFGPIAYAGAVAWCADANHDLDLAHVLDDFVFGDPSRRLGAAVVELGKQWNRTGRHAFNGSPLQSALFTAGLALATGDPSADRLQDVVARIEHCVAEIEASTPRCADGPLVQAELGQAARLARHGAWRLLASIGGDAPGPDRLRVDLADGIAGQRDAWLRRARPGGLPDSLARLEATLAAYDR